MRNSIYKIVQNDFDKIKYLQSEKAGVDKCGSYSFCRYCSKKNKYPCGAAVIREHREVRRNVN